MREFSDELRRAQVGLFYFAGHGVQIRGSNYLMPVAADIRTEADAEDLSIDANYVLRVMEDSKVATSIVILDACRNNPLAGVGATLPSAGLARVGKLTPSDTARLLVQVGRAVGCAHDAGIVKPGESDHGHRIG